MIKFLKTNASGKAERLEAFEEGCWVDMVNPTDDEVEDVCTATGIAEEFLKAALDEEETARVERDEGVLLCLLDTPTITETDDGDAYGTIPMAVIDNGKCVVTVSLRGNPVLADFISNRIAVNTKSSIQFLLTFMLGNAKRFLSNLRQIDKKSLRVQAELHRSMKNKELIQLLDLEKALVYFSTSLNSNQIVIDRLRAMSTIKHYEDDDEILDDVIVENKQAIEMATIYRDIMSGTMDAFASVISNNQNTVMKFLAAITIILTIPTIIASIWGMNVGVPFAGTIWGFWAVIGIIVAVTVPVLIIMIKKRMF